MALRDVFLIEASLANVKRVLGYTNAFTQVIIKNHGLSRHDLVYYVVKLFNDDEMTARLYDTNIYYSNEPATPGAPQ